MRRNALLAIIGVLSIGVWACAPPPVKVAPTGPIPAPVTVSCGPDDSLLNHVHYTKYTPPTPITPDSIPPAEPIPINPDIQQDLAAAFNANPGFAQNQLCHLNGIYINRVQCSSYDPGSCSTMTDRDIADNSWGFRTPSNRKFVAVSLGLWRDNGPCPAGQTICAPPFQTYHARLLRALLDRTAQNDPKPPPPFVRPFVTPPLVRASSNTSGISVLAALAHETGHIYWWDRFVQPPGSPHATNTASFCSGTVYPGGKWEGAPVDVPPDRWVDFGYIRRPAQPDIAQLPHLLKSGRYLDAGDVLDRVYASGKWASALAAYSPDEDFVESFELSVLRNAGLKDLTIVVTGRPSRLRPGGRHVEPIVQNGIVAPALGSKLQCFDALSRSRKPL